MGGHRSEPRWIDGACGLVRSVWQPVAKPLLVGAALAVSAPGGDPLAQAALPAGDYVFTVVHDGAPRRYLAHVPRSLAPGPVPLMMALHGGGGHAEQFKRENGLDRVADRAGFVAVYPDGTGRWGDRLLTWNAGDKCCGWAREHGVDDVGFLAQVLEDLRARVSIDARRVYVTGHSNGAMMAYRFAAERADLVTAIVPVGGAMDLTVFRPSREVAVLHIHSVDDPRALYGGGLGPPFPGTQRRVQHAPVMAGIERWVVRNGCAAQPVVAEQREGSGPNHGQTATRLVFPGCRSGGEVQHLRLTGVGHGWPGAPGRVLLRELIGRPTTLVNASEEAWAFAAKRASHSDSKR